MVVHFFKRGTGGDAAEALPLVAPDERIYAIGDVHGRYDLMIRLLDRLHEDAIRFTDGRRPRFVFLGDVIDRGEDTKAVLDALLSLSTASRDDIVLLYGNHEHALLNFLSDPLSNAAWLDFGGLQTLASFGVAPPRTLSDPSDTYRVRDDLASRLAPYMDLLSGFRPYLRSGDVVFTHAGLDPSKPVEAQDEFALTLGHSRFLVDRPVPGLRVVHGHYDAAAPVRLPGRICVDTGAYYSGVLTAVRLDSEDAFLSASTNAFKR